MNDLWRNREVCFTLSPDMVGPSSATSNLRSWMRRSPQRRDNVRAKDRHYRVTVNPQRHVRAAANTPRFRGIADMAGLAARSIR